MSDQTKTLAIIPQSITELERFAQIAVDSGLFSDLREIPKAMIAIQAGSELGISPIRSLTSIHIIKGKVTLSANLIAAQLRRAGIRYRVKWQTDNVEIVFFENGEEVGTSTFSMQDAKTAGLLNNPSWKKYPRNMLFARAMSNGARWYFPEVSFGAYTPEELGSDIQIEPEPQTPQIEPPQEDQDIIDVSPELEPPPKDTTYPSEAWKKAHRHLMAIANEVEIKRDQIKTVADVSSLTEFDSLQLDQIRSEVSAYGIAKEHIEKAKTIEALKSIWGKLMRSGLHREAGLFFKFAEDLKDQKKEQFNEPPQE